MTLEDLGSEFETIIKSVNSIRGMNITQSDVLRALILTEVTLQNITHPTEVWDFQTTKDDLTTFVLSFDFGSILVEVEHDTSIDYKVRFQTKVNVKTRGEKWIVHKNDPDPFPSNPHAHNFEQNLKLDLSDGNCFRIRKYVLTIPKKELLEIRKLFELRGCEMPSLRI